MTTHKDQEHWSNMLRSARRLQRYATIVKRQPLKIVDRAITRYEQELAKARQNDH